MSGMATEPALGTRIRRARERKRWTQQQLADALSVGRDRPLSVRTVNDWENDRTQPRNSLGALEEVLGVRLGSDEPEPDDRPPFVADAWDDEFVRKVWGTKVTRAQKIAMIRAWLDEQPRGEHSGGERRGA